MTARRASLATAASQFANNSHARARARVAIIGKLRRKCRKRRNRALAAAQVRYARATRIGAYRGTAQSEPRA